MKVLVTGGAGFVGSHVVDKLVEANIETSILVSGFRSQKHPSIINPEAHIIKGDLRNYNEIVDAMNGIDVVFHLGGVFSHYCEEFPELTMDVNIKGTWNLKKACYSNKVSRIIYASSSFIYGESQGSPIEEEHPTNPKSLLGITKLAGEKILQATYPYKIDYAILRLFNVYGPRQYPDEFYTSVITTWIKRALEGKQLEIHGDGTQALDFVYVTDVADTFVTVLDSEIPGMILNVGSGKAIPMNGLALLINTLTKNQSPPYYNPGHPAFLKYVQADIRKIGRRLGWQPKVSLVEGIQKTIDFMKGEQQ